MYLVDASLHRILHYDRNLQTLTPFSTNTSIEANMSLYAAADMSVYAVNPNLSEVLHFGRDGIQLPSLVSPGNLTRPVCVTVDERNGFVLVADELFNQIVAFDNWGNVLSTIKLQQVRSISAMAIGPDGIYILDPRAKQVIVLRMDGSFLYSLNTNATNAMAVSHDNLIFVGDNFSRSIDVYKNRKFLIKVNANGSGAFKSVAGLAIDKNQLYIADSLGGRVHIMSINPINLDVDSSVRNQYMTISPAGQFRQIVPGSEYRLNGPINLSR
jgi:hypothetical protein